jgi:hypothetical protein
VRNPRRSCSATWIDRAGRVVRRVLPRAVAGGAAGGAGAGVLDRDGRCRVAGGV